MKGLIIPGAFVLLFACEAFASEHSVLARVTVYWHGEGSGEHAAWNGARLHERHCAVDPEKIPYGSKVVFPDATLMAVDSGPGVINRKAARSGGRTAAERNAIVIDRFFHTKQKALAWAKAHPHFMTVRILTPGTKQDTKLLATKSSKPSLTHIASSGTTSWREWPSEFYQRFESSVDGAAAAVARFSSAIRQALDMLGIGVYALLFAIDCALLATVLLFYSSIIRRLCAKFFLSFSAVAGRSRGEPLAGCRVASPSFSFLSQNQTAAPVF